MIEIMISFVLTVIAIGSILATYFCIEAGRTDNPYRKEFYYYKAKGAAIDAGIYGAALIIAIAFPPAAPLILVAVIMDVFTRCITWLILGESYSMGELAIEVWCCLTFQDSPKEKEKKLKEAANWLNARLKAHADKGEYAIFIGGL